MKNVKAAGNIFANLFIFLGHIGLFIGNAFMFIVGNMFNPLVWIGIFITYAILKAIL